MVSEDQNLDELILQIFEEKEDTFFFPVATQNTARAFVKAIHSKGFTYEDLGREIEEFEINFSAWRKGLGRPGIGKRVIERINRPLQEILDSDDDEEILQVYRNMTNKKKEQVEANQREIEERLGIPRTTQDTTDSKRTYSNGSSHIQNSSASSSASRDSTPLSRDLSSRESTPMSQSSPSKTQSRDSTPLTESGSSESRESTPATNTTTSASNSRESTPQHNRVESVKKESELSRMFNRLAHKDQTDSGSEASSGTQSPVKKDVKSEEKTQNLQENDKSANKQVPIAKPRGSVPKSPIQKESHDRTESEGSEQESFHSAKSSREQTPSTGDDKYSGETREERLAKLQVRIEALKKKFPKDEAGDELGNENGESNISSNTQDRAPIVKDEELSEESETESEEDPKQRIEIVDQTYNSRNSDVDEDICMENYDSDLDPDMDDVTREVKDIAAQICKIKSSNPDGQGYVYVFTDSNQDGTAARQQRMKVGVSRNPHKRLQQATEFNVDMEISLTCSVGSRQKVLAEVFRDLKQFALESSRGWYKGPAEIILDKVSRIADKYPILTSNC